MVLIVLIMTLFNIATAISHLAISLSFVILKSSDIYVSLGPHKSPSSVPLSLGKLSCVGASVRVGLHPKTMFQVILPFTSVNLSLYPLKKAFTVKFSIFKLSKVTITTRVLSCPTYNIFYPFKLCGIFSMLYKSSASVNEGLIFSRFKYPTRN